MTTNPDANVLAQATKKIVAMFGLDSLEEGLLYEALEPFLAAAQAEIAAATSLLPATYYADRTLAERIGFLVEDWRKLVPLCEQFEAENVALRVLVASEIT